MKLPPKRRKGEGPRPPPTRRRQVPYTARGQRFRVQGPEPSSAGLKPGARQPRPWGLAAPEEEGEVVGSREKRCLPLPRPLPQPCA